LAIKPIVIQLNKKQKGIWIMNKLAKRAMATMLTGVMLAGAGFTANNLLAVKEVSAADAKYTYAGKTPKYIFMFIGDGMSYAQIQAAGYYQGVLANGIIDAKAGNYPKPENLSFTKFPVAGTVTTYDSTSLCPDSASTATSLSTGKKTLSGVINMDETKTVAYETITEKLKKQLGYKIGVVSSVNIDHATPGAYYAHVPSRGDNYAMGLELVNSGFEYFAGGAFISDTSKQVTQEGKEHISILAEKNGYKVADTVEEINALSNKDAKVLAICPYEDLGDGGSIKYSIDSNSNQLSLADYTRKGIEVLDNEKGFFMMVEGGKIDWACHANDAASTFGDTVAFDKAVQEAVNFYNQHPAETLILVTGDHETGGLTIGFAGTNYDTHLQKIANQKVSYVQYDNTVKEFVANGTSFEEAMGDVKANFGLMLGTDAEVASNAGMVLTEEETARLQAAYAMSMVPKAERKLNQDEYVLYGSYEPFSVTLTHILNNKAGINFASYSHTGVPVGMFAKGAGSELFDGYYDNTNVFDMLQAITKVK
jgi:alkaline phosphatase